MSGDVLVRANSATRLLFRLRFGIGRLLGWDRRPGGELPPESYVHRLTATQREEPLIAPGTLYGPRMTQVDLRLGYSIRRANRHMRLTVDLFNLFNENTVLGFNNTFGPQWQRPTGILSARLVKLGEQPACPQGVVDEAIGGGRRRDHRAHRTGRRPWFAARERGSQLRKPQ